MQDNTTSDLSRSSQHLGQDTFTAKSPSKSTNLSSIEQLFGYSLSNVTNFVQSGVTEGGGSTVRSNTVQLVYPNLVAHVSVKESTR